MVMVTLGGVESQSVELELVSVDYPRAYYINENLATMNPQVGLWGDIIQVLFRGSGWFTIWVGQDCLTYRRDPKGAISAVRT